MSARRHRRGAAALELALTLPVLLVLLGAIVDVSRLFSARRLVQRVARDAARAAAQVSDPAATGEVEATARAQAAAEIEALGLACEGACAVEATWSPQDGWWRVTVGVEAPYRAAVGLVPGLPATVRAEVTMLTREQR